jgi:lysophospholipase L1-like esterase
MPPAETPVRPSWLKGLAFGIYLIVAGAVVLGTVEAAARLGFPNSAHRDMRRRIANVRNAPSVVVLGDSLSVGEWPGLTPFTELLRERFSRDGVDLINLATPGTGTLNQLDRYRKYGVSLQPRLVVVNYYVGNDVTDTIATSQSDTPWKPLVRTLSSASYFANVLIELRQAFHTRARLADINTETLPEAHRPINPFLADVARRNPQLLRQNLLLVDDPSRAAWARNTAALLELRALVTSTGATFVVNVFPHPVQVHRRYHEFFQALGFEVDERYLTDDLPQRAMVDFCRQHDIACLDFLPVFRASSSVELFLDRDDHWNAAGHRLVFDTAWRFLRDTRAPG